MRVVEIVTSVGTARAYVHPADPPRSASARPVALVLGHGAGGGVGARDLAALAAVLPGQGVTVVLVEQPWRVAGGRVAPAPPRLDVAWTAVLAANELEPVLRPPRSRLVIGGRSAGARVACRTAVAVRADRVVCLAFPLHPPGRPERSRADELLAAGRPALVLQGERDPFGGPDEVRAAVAAAKAGPSVSGVPFADHGFAVPAKAPVTQREALDLLTAAVARFVLAR